MRMLYWPLRSPTSASKRLPGNAARSLSDVAASIRSGFRRADRSKPENALTRFPAANSLVLLIADDHYPKMQERTRYVKRKGLINMQLISWTKRVIHVGPRFWTAIKLPLSVILRLHMY